MVAEILAGIALVKSASEAISSCKDISQIAGHLDKLLTGAEQCKKISVDGGNLFFKAN